MVMAGAMVRAVASASNKGATVTLTQDIYDYYERTADNSFRTHLGASLIGHECNRYLWYSFHWSLRPKFGGRMLLLFDRGQKEEERFCQHLRNIGIRVIEKDKDGNQKRVSACGGHFGGSLDGAGKGFKDYDGWRVLEFKTHGEKSFKQFETKTVFEAKPQHYAQMQAYMHLTGLEQALYLAVNKNTDALYDEVVVYDKAYSEALLAKAHDIIFADCIPVRTLYDGYWQCRFCDYKDLCMGDLTPEINCRTCAHSTPREGGYWACEDYRDGLTTIGDTEMRKGCKWHLWNPDYFAHHSAVDNYVIGEYMEYLRNDGVKWKNFCGGVVK